MFHTSERSLLYKSCLHSSIIISAWLWGMIVLFSNYAFAEIEYPESVQAAFSEIPEQIDFNFHVKPILSDRCFACHGPDENHRMMNLRLDTPEGAYGSLMFLDGSPVVPHQPENSYMLERILSEESYWVMPPSDSNLSLSDKDKAILIRWIEQGAEYKKHWSFIPLDESEPTHENIDAFIAEQHEIRAFSFSPEADRRTLIRRVTFDLTGLPPTVDEIHEFVNDQSPDAYETLVDRLLASPHYGERMAQDWLDLARYSDTYGYQADNYRPMWRWRDWVIEAFNSNMPYDRFLTEQLAGDLLESPTRDQILATGFNRNHPQNAEGGIINEEFRVEYVADRTNTFGKAFLGMTMECARCHDHKYDPISHEDYYSMFSFFNQVDEAGQITWTQNDIPSPTLLVMDERDEEKLKALNDKIHSIEAQIEQLRESEKSRIHEWIDDLRASGATEPSALKHAVAHISLDQFQYDQIANAVSDATGRVVDPVSMALETGGVTVAPGVQGDALQLDGDAMLDFPGIGRFRKGDPFSIGLWIHVPEDLEQGVVFHSNRGGIIYSFKGYQLSIEQDSFDIRLAHTFPANSIHLQSADVPREQWIHVMMTYSGGGAASDVRFYLNGQERPLTVMRDQLEKDIVFIRDGIETNLRIGARWRSKGFSQGKVDEIRVFSEELSPLAVNSIAGGDRLNQILSSEIADLSDEQFRELAEYYLHDASETYAALRKELQNLRHQRDDIREHVDEVMVMREMKTPRKTHLLKRGIYNDYGVEVLPDTPDAIAPMDDSYPPNRLGLAKWLVSDSNPLTARVLANRLWQQFFEKPLVSTPEDFGNQGALPSHPQLLDWLAQEIIRSGWNVKAMQKEIVLSQTYRQASALTPDLLESDPENIWLARGPRKRLSAEMLRDQALAASGLLNRSIGGPSVKPYQPEGLWSFGMNPNYEQSTGDDLYRRSVYTFWKRTAPPPSMNLFDAPSRSVCTVRRQKTDTPMQALVLMNDPQFIEASRELAANLLLMDSKSDRDRFAYAYEALTSQAPSDNTLDALVDLSDTLRQSLQDNPERMFGLLSLGEKDAPADLNPIELSSYTLAVNTILNSDASVVKR